MFKWVLYALILFNVFVFLWFYSHQTPVSQKRIETNSRLLNSEYIKLVKSGKKTSEPVTTEKTPSELINGVAVEVTTESPQQPTLPAINNPQQLVDASKSAEDINPPNTTPPQENTANPLDQEESEDLQSQTLPQKVKTGAENTATEVVSPLHKQPPQVAALEMICFQYGPLDKAQAEIITETMLQQQIPVVQQSRILVEKRGYLVLIKPQTNDAKAKQQMRIARNAGLDAFTITKGEWIHGVSLGIFSTKDNADKFLASAKKLLPKSVVQLQQRFREKEVFRLIFKLLENRDPEKILASEPFPRFDLKDSLENTTKIAKKSCETVEF